MTSTTDISPQWRFVLYSLCGGCGVFVDFLAYWALISAGAWYQGANSVGYAAGTVVSFFLNRAITFRMRDALLHRFTSFVSVAVVGYLLSAVVLWLLADRLQVGLLIAKSITLIVVVIVQYSLNSLMTFRTSGS